MPAANIITINDGSANVAFTPESISTTHVLYQNLGQANAALRELVHYDRPAKSADVRRSFRTNMPVEVTLADGTKVVKWITFKTEMVSPLDVPVTSRNRARVIHANGMIHADTVKIFDNPEWVY